jgi:hypothetical protein
MILFRCVTLLSAVLIFSGCAHYEVEFNGFTDISRQVTVKPGATVAVVYDLKAENLAQEKAVKEKIEKLLKTKGYKTGLIRDADYFLFFWYGIGTGQDAGGKRPLSIPGAAVKAQDTAAAKSGTDVEYNRWLQLKLIDGKRYGETSDTGYIWIGEARSSGPNASLMEVVDYMLLPAFDHFCQTTGKGVMVKIDDGDNRVKDLLSSQEIKKQ